MISTSEHYYSMALFAYVISGLTFAAVRWFHVCFQYKGDLDYYYPDRKIASLIFLCSIILIPNVLFPADEKMWMYVKAYFIILIPFYGGVLLLNYFGSVKQWTSWRMSSMILSVPFTFTVLALFLIAIIPSINLSPDTNQFLERIIYVEGFISVIYCMISTVIIIQWLRLANEDYSNIDDFPVRFAKETLIIPILHIVLIWPPMIYNNKNAVAVVFLILMVCNICLLILVLSSKRTKIRADIINEENELYISEENKMIDALSQEKVDAIIESIKNIVEKEKQYLNPHLSLQDIVEQCHYGRTYVSYIFKNYLGGFFNYVNKLRIDYSETYKEEHPMATTDEIASASGFTSRQSFYRVKKRIENN